jgi:hypothetical protein
VKPFATILAVLLLVLASSTATAKPAAELMRHVPGVSPVIVGLEMSKINSSYLFKETMAFLKKAAKQDSVLGFVLSKKPFDLETDLDGAVVAFATAPMNPQAPPPAAMAVITGRFDQERVKTAVAEKYGTLKSRKVGKLEVFSTSGVDFTFVDATTLVIAESGFAAPTWKAVSDPKSSAAANTEIQGLLKLTDTTRGIWFTMNTKSLPTPTGAAAMDGAGIAVDLRRGLSLDVNSKFAKPEDATKAKEQFDELKKTSAEDSMLDMFGAKPLVGNMVATVKDGRVLNMATAITDAEVRLMVQRIKAMNEQPPPIAPSGQPTTGGPTTRPTSPGQGADADFN